MKYFTQQLRLQLCSHLHKRNTHGIEKFVVPTAIFNFNHLRNELCICLSRVVVTFGFIIDVDLIENQLFSADGFVECLLDSPS
jgi:hypothetical protein